MSEEFSLTLDIDEENVDLEVLREQITSIPEVEKVKKTAHMGVGICLILVLIAPLITEIIRRNVSPEAIGNFKKVVSNILARSKELYQKIKLEIKYKRLTLAIQTEEEIDKAIEDLRNYI